MLLKIKTPFSFSHNGYAVVRYDVGTIDANDKRLIEVALSEGYAEKVEKVTKKKTRKKAGK